MQGTIHATNEQMDFISALKEKRPCYLSARAGTGKTSTIKMAFESGLVDFTALAFNKKNSEDLAKALPRTARVMTLHSRGFSTLRSYFGARLTLEDSKVFEILKKIGVKGKNRRQVFSETYRLVGLAKNFGIGATGRKVELLPDTPESWKALAERFDLLFADLEIARAVLAQIGRAHV